MNLTVTHKANFNLTEPQEDFLKVLMNMTNGINLQCPEKAEFLWIDAANIYQQSSGGIEMSEVSWWQPFHEDHEDVLQVATMHATVITNTLKDLGLCETMQDPEHNFGHLLVRLPLELTKSNCQIEF